MRIDSFCCWPVAVGILCGEAPAVRRLPGARPAPRPWGDPDLQGIYTNKDGEQHAVRAARRSWRATRCPTWPERRWSSWSAAAGAGGHAGACIGGTAEQRYRRRASALVRALRRGNAQPWLVIEPDDGMVPPLTQAARRSARPRGRRRARGVVQPIPTPTRSLYDRCISRGVPRRHAADHLRRVVRHHAGARLCGRPQRNDSRRPRDPARRPSALSPKIGMYMGDSRGHWEGDTLVVVTTNIHDAMLYRGASSNLTGDRAVHPGQFDRDQLDGTHGRSHDVGAAVGDPDAAQTRRHAGDLRVWLPRGESRPREHPARRARRGAPGSRGASRGLRDRTRRSSRRDR
jgi:hypothetical protein